MAKVMITESYLEDIADAIREKKGVSTTYYPSQMAEAISTIVGGTPVINSLNVTPSTSQQTFDSSSVDGYKPVIGVEYSSKKNMDYFVYDIKKYMGKKLALDDIKGNITYKITQDENGNIFCFDEKMTFETMAKFLIEKVVETTKEQFKEEINFCTISVPLGFNNDQRTSVINAANAAGIKTVFIINDPLSTSIYYISKNKLLN